MNEWVVIHVYSYDAHEDQPRNPCLAHNMWPTVSCPPPRSHDIECQDILLLLTTKDGTGKVSRRPQRWIRGLFRVG